MQLPTQWDDLCGYRFDMVVEDALIVEVKAIERLERVHGAQLRRTSNSPTQSSIC